MISITTPISHLFEDESVAEEILTNSDNLECRDHSVAFREDKQVAFHCELQPIHPLSAKHFDYLRSICLLRPNLQLISFHVACCCDKPTIINGMFELGGTIFSREEMMKNATGNFKEIKNIFGPHIKIAVENNNFYPTKAYENVAEPAFLKAIVIDNDICFLFDIAHARVSAHNKNMSYEEYKSGLPMDRTVQLHICRYGINENGMAYDAHFAPDELEYTEIEQLINKYGIEYLTVEYYKDKEGLLASLNTLKKIIQ